MTKTQIQEMVDFYIDAEKKVLKGQMVRTSDGKTLTRADLVEIRKGRESWERRLSASGKRKHALASFN